MQFFRIPNEKKERLSSEYLSATMNGVEKRWLVFKNGTGAGQTITILEFQYPSIIQRGYKNIISPAAEVIWNPTKPAGPINILAPTCYQIRKLLADKHFTGN